MKRLKSLLFFYKIIVLPALGFSLFSLLFSLSVEEIRIIYSFGIFVLFFLPVFHFINYEIRKPNTYYFYYNFGWSKLQLWLGTLSIMSIVGLLLLLL